MGVELLQQPLGLLPVRLGIKLTRSDPVHPQRNARRDRNASVQRPGEQALWAGMTESTNPKDAATVIGSVVDATIKEMTKQGLLRGRK